MNSEAGFVERRSNHPLLGCRFADKLVNPSLVILVLLPPRPCFKFIAYNNTRSNETTSNCSARAQTVPFAYHETRVYAWHCIKKKIECKKLATKNSRGTYLEGSSVSLTTYQFKSQSSTNLSRFKMAFSLFLVLCPMDPERFMTMPAMLPVNNTIKKITTESRVKPLSCLSATSNKCKCRNAITKKMTARLPFPMDAKSFIRPCSSRGLACC